MTERKIYKFYKISFHHYIKWTWGNYFVHITKYPIPTVQCISMADTMWILSKYSGKQH